MKLSKLGVKIIVRFFENCATVSLLCHTAYEFCPVQVHLSLQSHSSDLVPGFVQTLESPGILLFSIPGLESPGKGVGPGKPWKFLESPGILKPRFWIFQFLF